MGISYSAETETITVTGGSQDDPYTMQDVDDDPTAGQYVTPGGYGNKEYAVSKHLVIGSDAGDTFFDITDTIIKMDTAWFLTVYSSALRGGKMGATFADRIGSSGSIPLLDETVKEQRIERVRKLYLERTYCLDNMTGGWGPEPAVDKIVAVVKDDVVT